MSKKIGFIPLRKGSKGIKNKNTRKLVGRPLYAWVLTEAIFSDLDKVYVYSDDENLIDFISKEYSWSEKVVAMLRSDESASDTASTELAMLEFCQKINFDFEVFCLLQATSPLTSRFNINDSLTKLIDNKYDSILSVVKTHKFSWNKNGTAVNYDIFNRPRRQDFDGLILENGAIYCTSKKSLMASKNRISNSIGLLEMDVESLLEIDSETDWVIVEQLLINRQKKLKSNKQITHLILDVDGVFTDGCVYYSKDGELTKKFDMRDGMGLEILREYDVEVIVMTSEKSELVAKRMQKLKINEVYLGVKDKFALLNKLVSDKGIDFGNLAYMGDDINDFANILTVGWSLAPNNAMDSIKLNADIVLSKDSGNGTIREACNFILNYNKRFN